jgi:hypothetical protein
MNDHVTLAIWLIASDTMALGIWALVLRMVYLIAVLIGRQR